ncbi:MAG: FkbM family methyltransferase [Phycisphaerales bacterium]|nr:FkbM family methyltransferase [Phycisphaerales bacterium]MCB9864317.1 FkbM family methyltransferase [Phycisphaerales bacterium]
MKPPIPKRLLRSIMQTIPRTTTSFNIGKVLTRTILRPENRPTPVDCRLHGSLPMTMDIAEFASNDLYCLGRCFEPATLRLWDALAAQATTIIDLGSHVGTFAVSAASANPGARVIAVEACRKNLVFLRRNADAIPNIEVCPIAIATVSGIVPFEEDYYSGGGVVIATEKGIPNEKTVDFAQQQRYLVKGLSLHDFCVETNLLRIDLMKMDLEGLEHELLTGQSDFWSLYAPQHLVVEIRESRPAVGGVTDVFETMRQRGYSWSRIEHLLTLPRLRRWGLANWHFWRDSASQPVKRPFGDLGKT